jgi:hypothetical protein
VADLAQSPVRVRRPKRPKPPTEAMERRTIIEFAAVHAEAAWPELGLLCAIQNEQKFLRHGAKNRYTYFQHLKQMGWRPGLPDLLLPVGRHGFLSLWIEVKRIRGATVTTEQRWWHDTLRTMGHRVLVSYGAEAACKELLWYVQGKCTVPLVETVSRETEWEGGE